MKSKLLGSKGPSEESPIIKCLRLQIESCSDLQVYLDYERMNQLLATPGGIGTAALSNLFTLSSTICKSCCGEDYLDEFLESKF